VQPIQYVSDTAFFWKLTTSDYDTLDPTLVDDIDDHDPGGKSSIPRVNGAVTAVSLQDRNQRNDGSLRVPMHVLFNQAGRLCTRYNKEIRGTQVQQNFVQRLVSSISKYAFPLLYFHALLFPKHFWAAAKHDKVATLGCAPISCYRKKVHPDGFASNIEIARNLCTHASSSTATDDNFTSYLYDIQANAASAGIDSRSITRAGFKVSTASPTGLQLGDCNPSQLSETLDSSQGMMNLAAMSEKKGVDLFVTYTPNQADHPGLCHLHRWKESMCWTKFVVGYENYSATHRRDVHMSMEMAYTHILTRCWLEVRKLWINFIIYSTTTCLGKVSHAFFRDEYQECSGNLSHIHGLIGLDQGDMDNEEFQEFVCSLQRNCVGDLISSTEVNDFIEKGLFRDENDWRACTDKASQVLAHTYHSTKRCLLRKDYTGDPEQDYICKKIHPVFDSKDCSVDEFQPLPFKFSEPCLEILESIGLYSPPSPGHPNGIFHHAMLEPKRHVGVVHPAARDNMSPVIAEHFAFTWSMQNMQIVRGTNGVTRYVVKVS
jgi:hypothetical protein